MSKRPLLRLVPLCDPDDFQAALYDDDSLTLAELLQRAPALSTEPIAEALLQRPLSQLIITPVEAGPECGLYRPPGLRVERQAESAAIISPEPTASEVSEPAPTVPAITPTVPAITPYPHPQSLSEGEAVRLAYAQEIDRVASFLRSHLSVLVVCDKLVVEHLWRDMARRAGLREIVLAMAEEEGVELMPRSLR
ncbi:MAG TPA: ATP-binding protein, partial [Candidatus Competibacteraceae bacterium]|nr:ATP-binding protein [Candidatus Competibacteraceae bacterium]